jgi:hypothetical protein
MLHKKTGEKNSPVINHVKEYFILDMLSMHWNNGLSVNV